MLTFRCDFGRGISCEVHIADEPPTQGSHLRRITWHGRPTARVIRPYIVWMNSVNEVLANRWAVSFIHAFKTSKTTMEVWTYRPGKIAERTSTIALP